MLKPLKPFIRYPGGKSRHVHKILQYFEDKETRYREPFVGGGSVFLGGVQFDTPWINDIDEGVYDLWTRVKENPYSLIDLIEEHTTMIDHRKDQKKIKAALSLWKQVKSDTKSFSPGYRFLFLSKTCFSGVVTGGPTGGLAQNGNYNLMSRWAKKQTIKRIMEVHGHLQASKCRITNNDWQDVVTRRGKNVALYLDPPYLKKGPQCYREAFTLEDHQKLAQVVTSCSHRYVVTLDDVVEIRNAWKDCGIPDNRMITESWLYSMSGPRKKNKVGEELFIMDDESFEIAQNKGRGDV